MDDSKNFTDIDALTKALKLTIDDLDTLKTHLRVIAGTAELVGYLNDPKHANDLATIVKAQGGEIVAGLQLMIERLSKHVG